MAHSSSPDRPTDPDQPTDDERVMLLDLAERAILDGLDGATTGLDTPARGTLRDEGDAFVTLHVDGRLNGCIGSIGAHRPLGPNVAYLAAQAAFHDDRLPVLTRGDLDRLDIEISVLSRRTVVPATTRAELLSHVRPGTDGLTLDDGRHRAVFLPSVWGQIPDPDDFVDALLHKGGFPTRRWPRAMRAETFTTESFARPFRA